MVSLVVSGASCDRPVKSAVAQDTTRRVAAVRGASASLVLTPVLRIGSEDGRDDSFGRIVDVELGPTGRVYVADDLSKQVSVFDARGRLVGRVGRRGSGPGEFQTPWHLAVDARDSLFVLDGILARVSVFGPDPELAHSFRVPPGWAAAEMQVLPDGRLLIAAYDLNRGGVLHYFRRDGTYLSSIGPHPAPGRIPENFVSSLLGGSFASEDAGLVFAAKSPYELRFLDAQGRTRRTCVGQPGWTTPPQQAFRIDGDVMTILWPDYVHTAKVLALGNGVYLVERLHPRTGEVTVDLVRSDCVLLDRRVSDTGLILVSRHRDLLVGRVQEDYPQVVVYRYSVRSGP